MKAKINNNKLLTLKIFLPIIALLIIAFGCGCAFDKQISQSIYLSNKTLTNVIGGVISNVGLELGFCAVITVGLGFIISSYVYRDKQKWKTITVNAILIPVLIVILALFFLVGYEEWQYITLKKWSAATIRSCLLALTITGAFCLNWFLIKKLDQELVFKTLFWILMFLIALIIIRELLCWIWSRPRPRAVFNETTPIEYRPVWLPDPFRSFDKSAPLYKLRKSFPSGHTAASGCVLALMIALFKCNGLKTKITKYIFLSLSIFLIILVGFNRVVAGWHFLTDVSFGATIPICLVHGTEAILNRRLLK